MVMGRRCGKQARTSTHFLLTMFHRIGRTAVLLLLAVLVLPRTAAAENPVLTPTADFQPAEMMRRWLMQQADECFTRWEQRYAELKTPEQIADYQQQQKLLFIESLGGFPERTPLNARITGETAREGYRVEKVIYESQPGHYVTGLCFVPNSNEFQAPYPGVLVVCGHSENGKGYEAYQSGGALLALNGIVGLLIDPVCQGERYEHLKDDGTIALRETTGAHSLLGTGAILLGHNTARNEIWDGMRGIDYLQSRDDINPKKIGCMGNSGGGTQTAYLMALDDRIQAAAPACYITSFKKLLETIGPQDAEQNIFGQLKRGMDHADYLLMRAPLPVLMCVATEDFFSIEGAWDSFRKAKRIYTRLGYSDRIDLVEVGAKHGWNKTFREASVQWMCRWLTDRHVEVHEPPLQILNEQEMQVTQRGQALLMPGAKSAFDLNVEEFRSLQAERDKLWSSSETALAKVREIVGVRPLSELPALQAEKTGESQSADVKKESWVFQLADGIVLPAVLYRPQNAGKGPVLYVHPDGKEGEIRTATETYSALTLARQGHVVLAVDLRGTGETMPAAATWYHKRFGTDGQHLAIAYLLGSNYVGMRAEEIVMLADWLLKQRMAESSESRIQLVSEGRLCTAALHAAALEPQLFERVMLVHCIPGWETLISSRNQLDQFVNCIHGAARVYDLPQLRKSLGSKCELIEPVDALGQIAPAKVGQAP